MLYVCLSAEGVENASKQLSDNKYAELRLDLVKPSTQEMIEMLSDKSVSFIVTCRKGAFDEETSLKMLEVAAQSGADYIDTEIERGEEIAQRLKNACKNSSCKLIISYHNFEETPDLEELHSIIRTCINYGADYVKLACKVNFPEDNAKLLSLYTLDENIVAFGMGELGKITRVACLKCGSPITYLAPDEGNKTAPGQFKVSEMKKLLELI